MGNPKQKWTAEEEEALRAGILKYGPGKWKFIQRDPEFNKHLYSRSNIDLKDKWRNMSAAAGQGSREKSRAPKPKNPDCTVTPNVNCQTSAPSLPVANDSHADLLKDEQSKDAKNRYNAMVIEALSATKQPNGLDITSLMSYIEQRVDELPQNFRKLLGSRLRRLVARDELEKIDNCYRIKGASLSEAKPAIMQETQPIQTSQPTPSPSISREIFKKSATLAALSVVKGEDLSFQLAEAVREVERIAKMVEEEDDILKLANAIYEICKLSRQNRADCMKWVFNKISI
ncbi:hypothetical protein V2J09_012381 [Rumex salicifolius]